MIKTTVISLVNVSQEIDSGQSVMNKHKIKTKRQGVFFFQRKRGDKDQELIQSSTTPDPGYHMGK